MSKASEWTTELIAIRKSQPICAVYLGFTAEATVDRKTGALHCSFFIKQSEDHDFNHVPPKYAIQLARWILATFDDEQAPEGAQ